MFSSVGPLCVAYWLVSQAGPWWTACRAWVSLSSTVLGSWQICESTKDLSTCKLTDTDKAANTLTELRINSGVKLCESGHLCCVAVYAHCGAGCWVELFAQSDRCVAKRLFPASTLSPAHYFVVWNSVIVSSTSVYSVVIKRAILTVVAGPRPRHVSVARLQLGRCRDAPMFTFVLSWRLANILSVSLALSLSERERERERAREYRD